MKTSATLKSGKRLWGIYHTDREFARELGDPLRTVVEAPNKLIAEETAARLGFGEPWAHRHVLSPGSRRKHPATQAASTETPASFGASKWGSSNHGFNACGRIQHTGRTSAKFRRR
ncbi:MAG TPA: hypothetical protein VN784_12830 [Candidatus Limnocylindrales bacterium]|nr:hypothetical protein [Candidatus Limnocylindrales bacterium]